MSWKDRWQEEIEPLGPSLLKKHSWLAGPVKCFLRGEYTIETFWASLSPIPSPDKLAEKYGAGTRSVTIFSTEYLILNTFAGLHLDFFKSKSGYWVNNQWSNETDLQRRGKEEELVTANLHRSYIYKWGLTRYILCISNSVRWFCTS